MMIHFQIENTFYIFVKKKDRVKTTNDLHIYISLIMSKSCTEYNNFKKFY